MTRYLFCWTVLIVLIFSSTIILIPARASAPPTIVGNPVWAVGSEAPGSVGLFRHRFTTDEPVQAVELRIFADTRYEAWLDGEWVGRGPARFSHVRQEFDTLELPNLQPGEHVLAVLVQFAPNARRSESLHAGVQASLHGTIDEQERVLTRSSRDWRAIVSPAWNPHAEQIHRWQLIGPQELVDLRELPADWTALDFDEREWPSVQMLPAGTFPNLTPRSIEPLHFIPRQAMSLVETGQVSPGQQIIDIDPPPEATPDTTLSLVPRFVGTTYVPGQPDATYQTASVSSTATATQQITLSVEHDTSLILETTTPFPLQLNDQFLAHWKGLEDERRPDIYVIEQPVTPGEHRLAFDVPADGISFAIADNSALQATRPLTLTQPLAQGNNPGRRMLLGNPVPSTSNATAIEAELQGGKAHATIITDTYSAHYLLLDFGRTLHARPVLTAEGPPGTIIDIGWDERLTAGRALPAPGSLHHRLWQQVDSWVLDGQPHHLTTLDTRAGRYMLIIVWGSGTITLSDIHAVEETYVATVTGSFTSSDPLLNHIWQVGVDTLIPNMTDAYADPWRERGQWWGDLYAAFRVNRAAIGDVSLLRRGLIQFGDAIDEDGRPAPMVPSHGDTTFLVDYGMLWVEALHTYWQLTDDTELVRELLPPARRFMTFLRGFENDAGLLSFPPDTHWSQSAFIDWSGVASRTGESAALNALYAATLHRMAEMSSDVGAGGAHWYATQSSTVRATLQERLYLPEEHAFATSRFGSEYIPPQVQAQAWTLVYDAVPANEQELVAEQLEQLLTPFWEDELPKVELYGFYWVLEALGRMGETEAALELIRDQYGRLLAHGATTWWETFTSSERLDSSLSHAWGGAPTWFLSSHVLGAQWVAPGEWYVAPHPGDLQYAQGNLPMPEGTLRVAWHLPTPDEFEVTLRAPQETTGTLLLPAGQTNTSIYLDGDLIWRTGSRPEPHIQQTEEGVLIKHARSGTYTVRSEGEYELLSQVIAPCYTPFSRAGMKVKDHTLFEYADTYYLVTTQITLPLQTERDEYTFGYARTRDFCTWEHLAPALVAAGDETEQYIWAPHVIEEDGTFYMFYTSVNANIAQQIALATTTNPADADSWQKQGIVFQPQHEGMVYDGPHTWSDARDPMVLRHNEQYWMYYTGRDRSGGIVGVAVADTLDGPWQDQGAVLRTPEGIMPESPFVIEHSGRFYLAYTAAEPGTSSGTRWQWASSPAGPWQPATREPLGWAHDFSFTGTWWLSSYVIGPGWAIGISPVRWNTTAGNPPLPQISWPLFLPLVQNQA